MVKPRVLVIGAVTMRVGLWSSTYEFDPIILSADAVHRRLPRLSGLQKNVGCILLDPGRQELYNHDRDRIFGILLSCTYQPALTVDIVTR